MIMARVPFRISFVGGGSDLREFYSQKGHGAVVSTTINKYMYIMIHNYFHDKIRIKYSKTEDVNGIDEIKHPLVRECLRVTGIERGIEIASIADVPAGTGMGSSSTFTVCLLQALYAYKGKFATKEMLARQACEIEIDILKEPIGKQDQYAASYGGLNHFRFNRDESVFVDPVVCHPEVKRALRKNLVMYYLGNERKASEILSEQKKNMDNSLEYGVVEKMVELTQKLNDCLYKGDLKDFGPILHEGWLLKKKLASKISNSRLDDIYNTALKAGATGGKVLGAGGGGFFLFYCEPKYQDNLRKSTKLKEFTFDFDSEGSKIMYMD